MSGLTQFSNDDNTASMPGLLERVSVLETLGVVTPARTCSDLRRLGVTTSGLHWIDPDGPGAGRAPVRVHCDMRTGATRIGHNFAGEQREGEHIMYHADRRGSGADQQVQTGGVQRAQCGIRDPGVTDRGPHPHVRGVRAVRQVCD